MSSCETDKERSSQQARTEEKRFGSSWKVKSFAEQSRRLWNSSLLSDVEFSFRETAQSKAVVVPAHSSILAKNSTVFLDLITSNARNEKTVIEIVDCDPEVFKLFLLYLYNDDLELSADCLQDVSRLATKYSVSSVVEKCAKFAESILCVSNAFAILQCAEILKDEKVQQRCWNIVDIHTSEAIKREGFLNIDHDLMLRFLQRDSLRLREIDLFKALCNWIAFQHKTENQNSPIELKKELYSHLVEQIRFPLMSQKEFAEYVPQTKLLLKDDIIDIFSYFSSASNVDLRFSRKPRAVTLTRCRLFPASRKWFMYSGSCPEYLTLTSSSPLMFCGVRMFGSEAGKYSVSLEFYTQSNPTEILTTKKGVHESESEMLNGYFGFDVFFDKPVLLKARAPYTLKVVLDGPPSFYGCHGYTEVECDGKTVYLSRENCPVFSSFQCGQFAEVIFM